VPGRRRGRGTRLRPDLPPIRADIGLLERALDNLIGNALQYTGPGGKVTVEVRQIREGIGLAVSDSGPGIPGDDLPLVFDRFYRVERPIGEEVDGTGLGLAITKRIVELHAGSISVESAPDRGTTFSVVFAAAPV
jgi:signal transduction histidine kinase